VSGHKDLGMLGNGVHRGCRERRARFWAPARSQKEARSKGAIRLASPKGRATRHAQIADRILVDRIGITGVQRTLPDKHWKRVVFLAVNE
jgi:uncharacterized Fe-S cluster-containing radical SAM superfamily protein